MPSASVRIRDNVLLECILYMKKMHEGQKRLVTNAPYYQHPLMVLDLMERSPYFFSTEEKCAGLLHDIMEDSPNFSWKEVTKKFGQEVAGAIAMLSKTKLGVTSPEVYFAMLHHAEPSIIAIKLIDRLANTADFGIIQDVDWLEKYLDETIQLVAPLIPIMVNRAEKFSHGSFYDLGCWIDEKLQKNLHGFQARIREIRSNENFTT